MAEQKAERRTIGEMGTDARILYNFIATRFTKDGADTIGYAELSAAIGGRNVQGRARGILNTARKNVERDHNLLIETVSKEGIRKSDALEGTLTATIHRIGRMSRRSSGRVVNACVNREIPNDTRVAVGVQLSLLGAIQQFTKPKAAKLIEGKVRENEAKELPTADTIRLFGGNGK